MRLTTETNVLRSACRALLTVFYYSGEYQSKRSTKRQTEKWETVSLMHTAVFFILDAAVKSCLLTCTKLTQEVFFFLPNCGLFFSVHKQDSQKCDNIGKSTRTCKRRKPGWLFDSCPHNNQLRLQSVLLQGQNFLQLCITIQPYICFSDKNFNC